MTCSTMFLIMSVVTLLFIIPSQTISFAHAKAAEKSSSNTGEITTLTEYLFDHANSQQDLDRYQAELTEFFSKATPDNKHLLILAAIKILNDFNTNNQANLQEIETAVKPMRKRDAKKSDLAQLDAEILEYANAEERAELDKEYKQFVKSTNKAQTDRFELALENIVKLLTTNDEARIKTLQDAVNEKRKRQMPIKMRQILIDRLRELDEN